MQNIPSFNDYNNRVDKKQAVDNVETQATTPVDYSSEKNNRKATLLLDNPANKIFDKKNITMITVAVLGTALAYSVGRGQYSKLSRELDNLKNSYSTKAFQETLNELNKAKRDIESLSAKNDSREKAAEQLKITIQTLEEKLKQRDIKLPKDQEEAVEILAKKYREIIDGVTSIYENSTAPEREKPLRHFFMKAYDFRDSKFATGKAKNKGFVSSLLAKLDNGEAINIPLVTKKVSKQDIQQACIQQGAFDDIGKTLKTSMTTNYGKNIQWSNEKIARDILQNFYDGNNHTLDGVGLSIQQIGDKYRIKVSGASVFDYEKLLLLGNSSKTQNAVSMDAFDAGGFGEGAKVVIANLLSKDSTKSIKYGSADWELIFSSNNEGRITSALNKRADILEGNFIEFETSDKGIAQSIIKAADYFKHSKNSDFINATYENNDFAFRILKPGEKGNFYLTQRFEYKNDGAWDGNVEGLDLIFKRRPDEKKYQAITGTSKKLNFGRDRNKMDAEDVYQLSRVFLKDLSDDDLAESLLATRPHWKGFKPSEDTAIKNFVRAICDELDERKIGFNLGNNKICTATKERDVVLDFVRDAGYTIVSGHNTGLEKIGLSQAIEVFKSLSIHTPLKPTVSEAKKLKVLEEAISVVQETLQTTYHTKLQEIIGKIKPEDIKFYNVFGETRELIENLPDFKFSKEAMEYTQFGLNVLDENKCAQELYDYLIKKINGISSYTLDLEDNQKAISLLVELLDNNKCNNEMLDQLLTQLKNLAIIEQKDVKMPRFIFDRTKEVCKNTLGEAIIENPFSFSSRAYKGHWVDRNYLNNGGFFELLATWVHEICHKSGGDGTAEFTYKLTDIIESLLDATTKSSDYQSKLLALEKVFNEIQ